MANEQNGSKTMNIILWIVQFILALSLIWAGCMKLFQPADKLAEMWPWTADHTGLTKLTGVLDLLAGIGLIVPALLRIRPRLTIYAAYAIILLMVAASVFHISRGEGSQIGVNVFFLIFAGFIAWGRTRKAPITPKSR